MNGNTIAHMRLSLQFYTHVGVSFVVVASKKLKGGIVDLLELVILVAVVIGEVS